MSHYRTGAFGHREYTTIYAIDAPEVSRIKFGLTENIGQRLRTLQNGSPVPLTLIGHCYMPVETEQCIFRFLVEDRVHGEWFKRTLRVRSIAALVASKKEVELAEVLGMGDLVSGEGKSANLPGEVDQHAHALSCIPEVYRDQIRALSKV